MFIKDTMREVGATAVFTVVVLGFFSFSAPLPVHAEEDLEDLTDDLQKLEEQEEEVRDLIDVKQKEQDAIGAQISSLENESKGVEEDINESKEEITKIGVGIIEVQGEITKKENILQEQKRVLAGVLRSHYENVRGQSTGSIILEQYNQESLFTHTDRVSQTGQKVRELVGATLAVKTSLIKDEEVLEGQKNRVVDLTNQLEKRNNYIENNQSQKRVLAADVASQKDKYNERLSKIEEQQRDVQSEISRLEYRQIGNFSYKDLPSRKQADFGDPVTPLKITQGYGKTNFSKSSSWYSSHNGIDIGNTGSTKIKSAADGKVIATGNSGNYAYGKWVVVDHGNGLATLYGHLSKISVSKGKNVSKGTRLGTMGSTGYSTGTHLHFTVFVEKTFGVVDSRSVKGVKIPIGASVSPLQYLSE